MQDKPSNQQEKIMTATKPLIQETEYWEHIQHTLGSDRWCPLAPDGWKSPAGSFIVDGDKFDKEYFGEGTIRIRTGQKVIPTLAIKVRPTGRKLQWKNGWRIRVQIEYLGDGEPSTFDGGWLWLCDTKF